MKIVALVGLAISIFFIALLLDLDSSVPSAHAEQVQGDVDCDAEVDAVDALFILRYVVDLPPPGECTLAAGDVNCDGVINALDALSILRYVAGLSPLPSGPGCVTIGNEIPPAGPPPLLDTETNITITAEITVRKDCPAPNTHEVLVEWTITDAAEPVDVTIVALPSVGPAQQAMSTQLSGSVQFGVDVLNGGHVIALVGVESPDGFAATAVAANVEACVIVIPPPPGEGFGEGDLTSPPGLDGDIREVDIAHLGGSPQGPATPIIVTAAGTGSAIKLTSWTTTIASPHTPVELKDAAPLTGHRVQLHVLTPELSPKLEVEILVAAFIHNNSLWLTTWKVAPDGTLQHLDTRGYGAPVGFLVSGFAIAHRELPDGGSTPGAKFQVVTPVVGTRVRSGEDPVTAIRTVTWGVDELSGAISGLQASADWGDPSPDITIDIAHQDGSLYVVSYKDSKDNLVNHYWSVSAAGFPGEQGVGVSGLDIRGVDNVTVSNLNDIASTGLTDAGFLTAARLGTGDPPNLISWESRVVACDGGCYLRPYKIAADDLDMDPGLGVDLGGPPLLTPSRQDTVNANDNWGDAVAIGDFDGDGYDDMAVGVPQEDANGIEDSGQVDIMYGSANGLTGSFRDQSWTQESPGIPTLGGVNELFGAALAAGDFDNDGFDDLAIGVPRQDIGGQADAGAVHILFGSSSGITAQDDQFFHRDRPGFAQEPGDNDLFGEALAAGDFNGDGRDDLAIGIPFQDLPGIPQAGAVEVLYGAQGVGLTTAGMDFWHQDTTGIIGAAEEDDIFGKPLAAGDFNGDTHDDLAVGVRLEDVGAISSAGSLNVIYGSAGGLTSAANQLWNLDNMGTTDTAAAFDFFPTRLAAGDFNGDSFYELAIGVPDQDRTGADGAGAAYVLAGSGAGLTSAGVQTWDQDTAVFNTSPQEFEAFGNFLSTGDFDGSGQDDLAIGITGYDVDGTFDAGAVRVLYGTPGGWLIGAGTQLFVQGQDDLDGAADDMEFFGFAMDTGDLNGDGFDDLAAGATNEDVKPWIGEEATDAGTITVIYGSFLDGLDPEVDDVWSQGIERRIRAILTDALWEADFGIGAGEMYYQFPAGEPLQSNTASVTKVMTLLLTVEAILDGDVSLSDNVEVTALAAGTGGSKMGPPELEQGDIMPLDLLLHGMMLRSGNRASVAIAEHVAAAKFGKQATEQDPEADMDNFVDLMNQRALDLGMLNTLQTHPAGGSATTPQDQVTLWMHGMQYDLFNQIASAKMFDGCGNADTKCYLLEKLSDSGYPGLGGWKGGNGLVGDNPLGLPACVSCLVAEADRMTRKLITAFQQSGDRWGDADRLFDWGYQTLFTPDLRDEAIADSGVKDFALDGMTDTLGMTVVITAAGDLKVCAWQLEVDAGAITPSGPCVTDVVNDLPPGPIDVVDVALIDIAQVSALLAEGDFFAGYTISPDLILQLWRVAPKEP